MPYNHKLINVFVPGSGILALPTRARPQNLLRFIRHYHKTNSTLPIYLVIDDDDPHLEEYMQLSIPTHWYVNVQPRNPEKNVGLMKSIFQQYPNEPYYGFLADDLIPRTSNWDTILVNACQPDCLSYADDGFLGNSLATHPFLGGDFVRAIGWMVLDGLKTYYVDTVLYDLAMHTNRLRYFSNVLLEHMHPHAGKALVDQTYNFSESNIEHDKNFYFGWKITGMPKVINQINQTLGNKMTATNEPKKLKVACYTICKNESKFVDRWAASNQDADVRLVVDTGSSDDTVEKLKSHGVIVHSITVKPWRFDTARNAALNLLPSDVDVCIWHDLDEVMMPGWRQILDEKWEKDATKANHRFQTNDGPEYWHYKIHNRHHCIWKNPVHEDLVFQIPNKEIWIPNIKMHEMQDLAKDRSNYESLIELSISEGNTYWKTYMFLAGEQIRYGKHDKALLNRVQAYEACQDGGIVRSYIARSIANQLLGSGNTKDAENWYWTSIKDSGDEKESWTDFANYWYTQQNWIMCMAMADKAIKCLIKRDGFTYDHKAHGYLPYDLAAISAFNLGLKKLALEYGQGALDKNPNDPRLQQNLRFYENMP